MVTLRAEETGITLGEGASAASSDIFAVKVRGRGHGSRPDLSLAPNGATAMITEFV